MARAAVAALGGGAAAAPGATGAAAGGPPAAVGQELGTCIVEVFALDLQEQRYTARFSLAAGRPLRGLQEEWARQFKGMAPAAVGFEDVDGRLLDTRLCPSDLGWDGQVSLQAVPMAEQWCSDRKADSGPSLLGGREEQRPQSRSPASTAFAAERGSERPLLPSSSSSSAGAGGGGVGVKRPAPTPVLASNQCPVGDEPIFFLPENPKRPNTKGHARYEKYKIATTPREAMQMGAERGDLATDFKRGYLCRLSP